MLQANSGYVIIRIDVRIITSRWSTDKRRRYADEAEDKKPDLCGY